MKKLLIFLSLIILMALTAAYILDYYEYLDIQGIINKIIGKEDENKNSNTIVSGELTIVFLETGNKYTGDSIYIKAGDTDVLIDAGSRQSSSTTISNFINNYVTDSVLEYVIATHAHQDHIAGFVGTKNDPGIFELYDCKTIIDFPKSDSSSSIYSKYIEARDKEVELGAKHYTALECYNNENGASRIINLSDSVTLEILYNYYYDHKASTENDYSVCLMINHGSRKYLFTGDLEHKGEEYLVEYNTLGKVDLFKAGHHGSYTASTNALLDVIKPDIVCICCCAGSDEYTKNPLNMFPAQEFISRICKYTDKVYVTSLSTETGFESMNGNIIVSSTSEGISINCTNNNIILKDTEWFKKNRKWE